MFVLGPILVGRGLAINSVMLLMFLGLLINAFIFVVNDIADLSRDRLDPAKRNSPLVSGKISTEFALALAICLPLLMWFIIIIDDWPTRAEISFVLMLLLGAWLCVYQKTAKGIHPIIMDGLFATTMAAPIPVSIESMGLTIPRLAWLVTATVSILMFALNVIGGNLKDLRSDLLTGFRTTAIALGVRIRGERIEFTKAYKILMLGSWLITSFFLLVSILEISHDRPGSVIVATSFLILTAVVGMAADFWGLCSGQRPPHARGRQAFFYWGMGAVFVVIAAAGSAKYLAAALLGALTWELGFRTYWYQIATLRHNRQR